MKKVGNPVRNWMLASGLTAVFGPSFIGAFSLPAAPLLAAVAVWKATKEDNRDYLPGAVIMLVITLLFAAMLWMGMHPRGVSTSAQG